MRAEFNDNWLFTDSRGSRHSVCVPHDAMLTERRDPNCHNGKQSGYFPGGKYTYEKKFVFDAAQIGHKIELFFEGVYQNCTVTVNGKEAGGHKYGYTEFRLDISKLVQSGENTVSVFVDNSLEPNCRWYSGSGIYRPVWLLIDEPKEPKIRTLSVSPAVVEVEADGEIEIFWQNTPVYRGAPGRITIENARLWSAEEPSLYTLRDNGRETTFGIRELKWSAKTGLTVNGQRVLLRGGCIHHDNGVLGACGFADAEERRVRILKEAGYNAIRSAHNPMSRAMLDACDRFGMYVMDECFDGWYTPKNYHDYSRIFHDCWRDDLKSMVEKDYNHPSVIMYSVGNEVSETATDEGVRACGMMTEHVHSLDSSRPVTAGINVLLNVYTNLGVGVYKDKGTYEPKPLPPKDKGFREKKTGSTFFNAMAQKLGGLMFFMSKGKKGDKASKGAADKLDIIGLNYAASRYDEDVLKYPDRMMVGSETMVTDLPYNWPRVVKHPAIVGDFVWAAWDYLGEAGVGDWVYHSYTGLPLLAGSGTIDITGKITAEAYYQQVVWGLRKEPWIGVQPLNHANETPTKSAWRFTNAIDSWTWHGHEGQMATVEVYANAHAVRLECGTISQTRRLKDNRASFHIPYHPGTLTAVTLDAHGKEISRHSLRTGGKQVRLTVKPEQSVIRPGDLAFIPIEFTDENGELLPYMEKPVKVKVDGAGALQGLGSAICKTAESYLSDTFTSYRGRLLAVIRANEMGKIKITASSGGFALQEAELEVR